MISMRSRRMCKKMIKSKIKNCTKPKMNIKTLSKSNLTFSSNCHKSYCFLPFDISTHTQSSHFVKLQRLIDSYANLITLKIGLLIFQLSVCKIMFYYKWKTNYSSTSDSKIVSNFSLEDPGLNLEDVMYVELNTIEKDYRNSQLSIHGIKYAFNDFWDSFQMDMLRFSARIMWLIKEMLLGRWILTRIHKMSKLQSQMEWSLELGKLLMI